ncbi:unnamed protein product [Natator depressus]
MRNWKKEALSTHPPAECFPVVQHGGEWTEVSSGGDIANLILNAQIPRDINRRRGSGGNVRGLIPSPTYFPGSSRMNREQQYPKSKGANKSMFIGVNFQQA